MSETSEADVVEVTRLDEQVELWAPRFGGRTFRRGWTLQARRPDATTTWHVVVDAGGHAFVLEAWEGVRGGGWSAATGRAWRAPPWIGELGDRLGPAPSAERVRALLLAGIAESWSLYDVCDDDGQVDDDEQPNPAWRVAGADMLDEAVVARGVEVARAFARGAGIDLELPTAEPLAVASRSGDYYSNGVAVLGWDERRVVVAARFAGAPALLVCDLRSDDDEPFESVLASRPPALRLVPFTRSDEAARVLRDDCRGFQLPRPAPDAPP